MERGPASPGRRQPPCHGPRGPCRPRYPVPSGRRRHRPGRRRCALALLVGSELVLGQFVLRALPLLFNLIRRRLGGGVNIGILLRLGMFRRGEILLQGFLGIFNADALEAGEDRCKPTRQCFGKTAQLEGVPLLFHPADQFRPQRFDLRRSICENYGQADHRVVPITLKPLPEAFEEGQTLLPLQLQHGPQDLGGQGNVAGSQGVTDSTEGFGGVVGQAAEDTFEPIHAPPMAPVDHKSIRPGPRPPRSIAPSASTGNPAWRRRRKRCPSRRKTPRPAEPDGAHQAAEYSERSLQQTDSAAEHPQHPCQKAEGQAAGADGRRSPEGLMTGGPRGP